MSAGMLHLGPSDKFQHVGHYFEILCKDLCMYAQACVRFLKEKAWNL